MINSQMETLLNKKSLYKVSKIQKFEVQKEQCAMTEFVVSGKNTQTVHRLYGHTSNCYLYKLWDHFQD